VINRYLDIEFEAATDESGAGPAFGPVVAAAVILPKDWTHTLINDSKKVSEKNREILYDIIIRDAVAYSIQEVSAEEIDVINILQARFLAMDKAVNNLSIKPEHLIIDGNRFYKNYPIPYTCLVKGDANYTSIAAASILAKVYRDRLIGELSKTYDKWELERHKGYLTKRHIELIKQNGMSYLHRKTFCKNITSSLVS
jgi:ribonuclease HII